jgi:Holliday junction resolvase YEN1
VALLMEYRLYEIIGDGEVWSLAEYAARHFEQHKRPLRIAVDEA